MSNNQIESIQFHTTRQTFSMGNPESLLKLQEESPGPEYFTGEFYSNNLKNYPNPSQTVSKTGKGSNIS